MVFAALRLFLCVFSVLFDEVVVVLLLREVWILVDSRRLVGGDRGGLVLQVILTFVWILLLDWSVEGWFVVSLVSVVIVPLVLASLVVTTLSIGL